MNLDEIAGEMMRRMERMPRQTPLMAHHTGFQGEIFLLNYLHTKGGRANPGEMSQVMHSSTARVSAALNNMERKGWVIRDTDPLDHRKTRVRITPDGILFITGFRAGMNAKVKALLAELGEEDAREYVRILSRIEEIVARAHTEGHTSKIWKGNEER